MTARPQLRDLPLLEAGIMQHLFIVSSKPSAEGIVIGRLLDTGWPSQSVTAARTLSLAVRALVARVNGLTSSNLQRNTRMQNHRGYTKDHLTQSRVCDV